MARKWHHFFVAVAAIVLRANQASMTWMQRKYDRFIALCLLGLLLFLVGMPVARSQMFTSRVSTIQDLYNAGNYYSACEVLMDVLKLKSKVCDGEYASDTTVEAIKKATQEMAPIEGVAILRSLGDVFRSIGLLKESQGVLIYSLKQAEKLEVPQNLTEQQKTNIIAANRLSLGNTYRALGNLERDRQASPTYEYTPWQYIGKCIYQQNKCDIPSEAKDAYDEARKNYEMLGHAKFSQFPELQAQAKLNQLSLATDLVESKIWEKPELPPKSEIEKFFEEFSNSRLRIYARINFAKNLAFLLQKGEAQGYSWSVVEDQLNQAVKESERSKDQYAKSYAFGNLGGLYEYYAYQKKEDSYLEEALQQTQNALDFAQSSNTPDIAYQWYWQKGRLLNYEGKRERAIVAYKSAVDILENIRGDLIAFNSDVQFSFRDNVEPVYRDLVDLLLKDANPDSKNLKEAIELVDKLQTAEIENFFRCRFSKLKINQGLNWNELKVAILYPIILKDRIAVIRQTSEDSLEYHPSLFSDVNLEELFEEKRCFPVKQYSEEKENKALIILNTLNNEILDDNCRQRLKKISNYVYNSLVQPFEKALETKDAQGHFKIDTLVFVLDGAFRNIPMTVLYDGKEYLLQKRYAVALTPSLKLFELKPLTSSHIGILAAGISKASEEVEGLYFPELKNVKKELDSIEKLQVKNHKILREEEFTEKNLQNYINTGKFLIVHLATHGQFSSNPQNTYVLSYNKLTRGRDLERLISVQKGNSDKLVELLVLSSCKTAKGDNIAVFIQMGYRNNNK